MEDLVKLSSYFKGKRVLVTGHTGFKGSWLCKILDLLGSETYGYSLKAPTDPNLYEIINADSFVDSKYADIRNIKSMRDFFSYVQPDIVIHMAAQPLVIDGYKDPRYTYETNVMGTVNVLECVRLNKCVKSLLNVTTDKVYFNREWERGYSEDDILNGYDPYSNSKSCSELVTSSYYNSFLKGKTAVSTARAGNVIGGGDFAPHRIIPDCVRCALAGSSLKLRSPNSIRPYQHVLESLSAYLLIVEAQAKNSKICGSYNIGPDYNDNISTQRLVSIFNKHWNGSFDWEIHSEKNAVHEANFLKLDNSKIRNGLGWIPKWSIDEAVEQVCNWTEVWASGGNIEEEMSREIKLYYGN